MKSRSGEFSKSVCFLSGFKQLSEASVDAASPAAGVCSVVLDTGRYQERARAQKWCIDSGICEVSCSVEVCPAKLEEPRVGDVLDVTVANGDALFSKLDDEPLCAGLSSLRGGLTKVVRPIVYSRVLDRVARLSFMYSSGESSRARMSYLDALLSAPARALAAALVARCSAPSSAAVELCMHDDGSLVNDGCSNSWSDTCRLQGPRGRKRVKGGVSGPVEDLLLVSELDAGVNFWPASGVREQVAGSLPGRQPGTGSWQGKGSVVTPSLHL